AAGAATPVSLPRFSEPVEVTEPSTEGAWLTPVKTMPAKITTIRATTMAISIWRFCMGLLLACRINCKQGARFRAGRGGVGNLFEKNRNRCNHCRRRPLCQCRKAIEKYRRPIKRAPQVNNLGASFCLPGREKAGRADFSVTRLSGRAADAQKLILSSCFPFFALVGPDGEE